MKLSSFSRAFQVWEALVVIIKELNGIDELMCADFVLKVDGGVTNSDLILQVPCVVCLVPDAIRIFFFSLSAMELYQKAKASPIVYGILAGEVFRSNALPP